MSSHDRVETEPKASPGLAQPSNDLDTAAAQAPPKNEPSSYPTLPHTDAAQPSDAKQAHLS